MYLIEKFENFNKPQRPTKGEYLIIKSNNNGDIFLIKITSNSKPDGRTHIHYNMKIIEDDGGIIYDIFYNIQHSYFCTVEAVFSLLWRGTNEDEGKERFKILLDTNKYNL